MASFSPYTGAYEHGGREFRWRCYATARVHGLRRREHGPLPSPPEGLKWVGIRRRHEGEPELSWLVGTTVDDFSQMLVQVEGHAPAELHRASLAQVCHA